MTSHDLTSTPETVATPLSRDIRPVLTVNSGSESSSRPHDVLAHLDKVAPIALERPELLGPNAGLIVPGPIEVRGAQPG